MPHECKSTYNRYTKRYQPYCSACGRFFSDQASCQEHLVTAPIEPEIALPAVEFGEYVTHKSPTPRSGDTLLGKVVGYLSELLFWADIEGKCRFVDVVVPDWFPINAVQGILWALFKQHYNASYQGQYNKGAEQGNKIHNAVFGWIDDATENLMAQINEAKRRIETDLINPIKAKIREIEPIVDDITDRIKTAEATVGKVEDRIDDARRDLEKHTGDIRELFDRVKTLEGKMVEQGNLLDWFKSKLEVLV